LSLYLAKAYEVTLVGSGYSVDEYDDVRSGAYGDADNDGILLRRKDIHIPSFRPTYHMMDVHIPSYRDHTPCHSGLLNPDTCFHLLF
jgi:hypothetical protein